VHAPSQLVGEIQQENHVALRRLAFPRRAVRGVAREGVGQDLQRNFTLQLRIARAIPR
jgi:hypothetical protein